MVIAASDAAMALRRPGAAMVMVPLSLMSESPEVTTYWLVSPAKVITSPATTVPGAAGGLEGDGRRADGITGGVGLLTVAPVPAVLVTIWPDSRTFRSLMRVITPRR